MLFKPEEFEIAALFWLQLGLRYEKTLFKNAFRTGGQLCTCAPKANYAASTAFNLWNFVKRLDLKIILSTKLSPHDAKWVLVLLKSYFFTKRIDLPKIRLVKNCKVF